LKSELLEHALLDAQQLQTLEAEIREDMDRAVALALASPLPEASGAADDVYGPAPDSIVVTR
jgi:TPP-dependent pyruvate/acetoin dehydrogenase alpha subunit